MKKILLCISLSVILVALSACGGGTISYPTVDTPAELPWRATAKSANDEYTVYDVTKYYGGDLKKPLTTSDSLLSFHVSVAVNETSDLMCTLDTTLKMVYNDDELNGANKGKTDVITSKAIFRADDLTAVYTQKTANLQTTPSLNYSFEADYAAGKATMGEKEISIPKGTYYDNEYLYYYVRALKSLGENMNETLHIVNWYESFLANELKTYSLTTSSAPNSVEMSDFIAGLYDGDNVSDGKIKCTVVQLNVAAKKGSGTGSPLTFAYAIGNASTQNNSLNIKSTFRKALLRFETVEYFMNGNVKAATEYTLKSISIDEIA